MKRIITYDLSRANTDDYEDLYEVLKELNGIKITESTYCINTSLKQKEIQEKIKSVIYDGDQVFYISVTKDGTLFYEKI